MIQHHHWGSDLAEKPVGWEPFLGEQLLLAAMWLEPQALLVAQAQRVVHSAELPQELQSAQVQLMVHSVELLQELQSAQAQRVAQMAAARERNSAAELARQTLTHPSTCGALLADRCSVASIAP